MRNRGYYFFCIGLAVISLSCNRQSDEPVGGKGGNATLVLSMKHHSLAVDSGVAYIKYNTFDKPSGDFDDSVKFSGPAGNTTATFSGLKSGKYFLYGKGYDPSIAEVVEGGIPHTITDEHTHNLTLPVTEAGH